MSQTSSQLATEGGLTRHQVRFVHFSFQLSPLIGFGIRVTESKRGEIVTLGGLKLLMPLTASKDTEVKRLAAHALANLSVDGEQPVWGRYSLFRSERKSSRHQSRMAR